MKYIVMALGFFLCLSPIAWADEVLLPCIQDAEVDEEEPDINKGGNLDVQIGATWGEEPVLQAKGLFEFEGMMTFPEYKIVIDEAVLQLYVVGNDLDDAPIDIFRVAGNWGEMSVTWNSRPAENRDIVVTDTAPPLEPPATLWEIDVTGIVQSWYEGFDGYGFYIDVPDNGISVDIDIASKENSDSLIHPKLWVDFHTVHVSEEKSANAITFEVSTVSRGRAEIKFSLPSSTHANIKIYDATGSLVETLLDGSVSSRSHRLTWDGTGVYFVRLVTPGDVLTRKLVLVK